MACIGIVKAAYNNDVTSRMLDAARARATQKHATIERIAEVPGVLDLPLVAKQLLTSKKIEGVVVLGFVKKGETDHDQLVAHQSVRALVDLSLSLNKPIGFGIIGPNATHEQGLLRAEQYASHAVDTVLALIALL